MNGRKAIATALILTTISAAHGGEEAKVATPQGPPIGLLRDTGAMIVENEFIVEFDEVATRVIAARGELEFERTGLASLDALAAEYAVQGLRKQFPLAEPDDAAEEGLPDLSGYYIVTFDADLSDVDEVMGAYADDPFVRHVEPIGIHFLYATPNDGNYSGQWHLNQANDVDIDAPEGWDLETGDPSIIVAVLDSGVRYFHKDLGGSAASLNNPTAADGNIWLNLAEKNGASGIDDDGNGYIDDWVGYDFVNGASPCWSGEDCNGADNDPRDFNGHGTHCAGNVSAINNNGYATASPAGGWGNGTLQPTANGVKTMSLRIGWSGVYIIYEVGYVRMDFAAQAFYYAADNGARIATCSWGSSNSGGIAAAIDYFLASGGLIFKAAGNDNTQNADYMCNRSDIYCVAATDQNDAKASFSTYGTWVDISAPGVGILSSYHVHDDPAGDYVATLDGTSMATPLVASVAAAVWSQNPGWSAAQVWAQVRDTADNIDAQNPSYVGRLGSGRVNLFNALDTGGGGCTTNADCDDGDPCNGIEQCVGGTCVPGSITDCNSNGIEDSCDISAGTSQDCNANGVPDECDISAGTSQDCNSNGVPDECDISSGFSQDCNANGIPDECEGNPCPDCFTNADCDDADPCNGVEQCIDGVCVPGSIIDCNSNGIEDACDISSGFSQDCNSNGIPDECEGGDPCGGGGASTLLMSFKGNTSLPGVGTVTNDDIAAFDTGTTSWSLYFDGSDVGAGSYAIDGLAVLPNGDLLISFTGSGSVGGVSMDDSDILQFTPTSLGANTAGSWSMYFDGSDVGLTRNGEDIDGIAFAPDGRLIISTVGSASVPGLSTTRDEDLIAFDATSLGNNTAGTWSYYFDGSDVGLASSSSEDVDAVSILPTGLISLSTTGNFSVSGLSGVDEDVFDFSPNTLGSSTSGSFSAFFIGADWGVPSSADVGGVEEVE